MIKSIIVAKAKNNVIGKDNDLVWHLPADQKYFRKTTMGHYVIMGRKTFESLPKPLPGRVNIIVTTRESYKIEGAVVYNSLEDAFKLAESQGQKEIFILGGGEIYQKTLGVADKLYITEIDQDFEGDTTFPEIDPGLWQETSRTRYNADEENPHNFDFVIYERQQ